jgi:hypothetical protein
MIQQAVRDQILSRMQVLQWHAWFKTGHTSVDNVKHTGRLTSCTKHRETHKLHKTQGDPQAAQLLKLSHDFKSSSIRIDVGLFTTLLRRWKLVMGHANGL